MPKLKTVKSAKKRFKVTGSGKITRRKAFASHILTKKSRKRKRNLRKAAVISKSDSSRVRKMIAS